MTRANHDDKIKDVLNEIIRANIRTQRPRDKGVEAKKIENEIANIQFIRM